MIRHNHDKCYLEFSGMVLKEFTSFALVYELRSGFAEKSLLVLYLAEKLMGIFFGNYWSDVLGLENTTISHL